MVVWSSVVKNDFACLVILLGSARLVSGDAWAIAGEGTPAAGAPTVDTFKNSRRFIVHLTWGCVSMNGEKLRRQLASSPIQYGGVLGMLEWVRFSHISYPAFDRALLG